MHESETSALLNVGHFGPSIWLNGQVHRFKGCFLLQMNLLTWGKIHLTAVDDLFMTRASIRFGSTLSVSLFCIKISKLDHDPVLIILIWLIRGFSWIFKIRKGLKSVGILDWLWRHKDDVPTRTKPDFMRFDSLFDNIFNRHPMDLTHRQKYLIEEWFRNSIF